ncbi:MAG: uncharacterized protein QOE12_712, partial [Mycobacterium sp.]|nr:uncharacterized protein [Mycobacterium sp.]
STVRSRCTPGVVARNQIEPRDCRTDLTIVWQEFTHTQSGRDVSVLLPLICALATVENTDDGGVMTGQIPLVDYLVLDDGDPHLVAQECRNCGARFFDRRNACASCFASEFTTVAVPTAGTVRAFTIVTFAAPGIPTPFVASVVDCDGTQVRTNLINVDPDPEHIRDGMKVRLATFPIGSDSAGTEAIGFGFEPAT